MEGWFSEPVEVAITGAVDIAKTHFQVSKRYLQSISEMVLDSAVARYRLAPNHVLTKENNEKFLNDLEAIRKNWGLFSIRIIKSEGQVMAEVYNPTSTIENFTEPVLKPEIIVNYQDQFQLFS